MISGGKSKTRKSPRSFFNQKGSWAESADEVLKTWERCRRLNDRLTRVGPLLDIPKYVSKRVIESFAQVKKLRVEWETNQCTERKRIKEKAAKHLGRDTLYRHAAEIQALDRQRDHITALESEAERAKTTIDEIEFEITAEMEAIGVQAGTKADRLPNISDEVIEALRGPARETEDLVEAAEETRRLAQSYQAEAEKVKSELDAATVRFGGTDIFAAYRKRAGLVQALQDRIGLDDRRDGLVRQMEEIEEEAGYWTQRSVLPWKGVSSPMRGV